jgi:hypothetical protein
MLADFGVFLQLTTQTLEITLRKSVAVMDDLKNVYNVDIFRYN